MKKRILALLMTGIIGCGLMAGCGSSDSDGSGTKKGKTELELFSSKAENKTILEKLVQKFNDSHEGVTVKITAPADSGTVLKTRMAKNDMPDILAIGGDANYTEVESAGMLVDLGEESYMDKIQESYLQMVYDINKDREEKAYGIPYATNASGVLYNVDKFKELNLEIPKTWTEFINVCEKIQKAGETPLLMTYKDAWTALCPWNSMAPELQPENFYDDKKNGKATFADTHEEIAQKYLKLLDYAQPDFMGTSYDDGNKSFANGDAVMVINGNWAINQYVNANAEFSVDMFAFPGSDTETENKVTSGVDVLLSVSNTSEHVELAKEFVAFMLEEENAQIYIDDQFAFSAIKGVGQEDETVSGVKEEIMEGNVVDFANHYYPSAFDLGSLLSEFCLNKTNGMEDRENIEQFLAQCDEKYDSSNVE